VTHKSPSNTTTTKQLTKELIKIPVKGINILQHFTLTLTNTFTNLRRHFGQLPHELSLQVGKVDLALRIRLPTIQSSSSSRLQSLRRLNNRAPGTDPLMSSADSPHLSAHAVIHRPDAACLCLELLSGQ
jgi:hypothetical protein